MTSDLALDPVLLARLQFAFTVSFHIIFPSFTIGIAPIWRRLKCCGVDRRRTL